MYHQGNKGRMYPPPDIKKQFLYLYYAKIPSVEYINICSMVMFLPAMISYATDFVKKKVIL